MDKISINNAEHYTWGENCDGWHLLKNDDLSVIEEKMPPGSFEQLHFHTEAQQVFYILSGEALFQINQNETRLARGETIHVPAGIPHKISNTADTDLRFIVISSPKAHGNRVNL